MTVTPMMAQYLEIKQAHKTELLFYRMGDFYEMFFDDAIAASDALNIALTRRGKLNGADIPMCGVPFHAADSYLQSLIKLGFRVAICEQMESPAEAKKRGYKSVVKRDVTRIVTPGTLLEDVLLEPAQHNFLAAYNEVNGQGALSWVDVSTGGFWVTELAQVKLGSELARINPVELLIADALQDQMSYLESDMKLVLTPLGQAQFDSMTAMQDLASLYGAASLDAFGAFSRPELSVMGALTRYIELTQKGAAPRLNPPVKEDLKGFLQIDAATRRNLELTESLSGDKATSLLKVIDKTVTAVGARLLAKRLNAPLTDIFAINARLDAIECLVERHGLREEIIRMLKGVSDFERALGRLSLSRGGPRDLSSLQRSLNFSFEIVQALGRIEALPEELLSAQLNITSLKSIEKVLGAALVEDPCLNIRDGGFIAAGIDAELDEVRRLRDQGRSVIADLQAEYQKQTSITALKVKYNKVLGYFVETPATHAEKMMAEPLSATFIHRQTTANQVRFTTRDLADLEQRILSAGDQAQEIEERIFEDLRTQCVSIADEISDLSDLVGRIDVAQCLAQIAETSDWVRPTVDGSKDFEIDSGRHPVVEASMRSDASAAFVANNCNLSASPNDPNIWIITGPNMAGKSTFLRQNALIAILAHMGSFVPARRARIGVVSKIFSRVGASDDLARGRSTFMVEMIETSAILNQADERSLVILDEIGRGTSTYDGLSIAWATLEHLENTNRCRALFATHYHELTHLAASFDGLKNATVAVKDWEGDIIFLHEVREGTADRSYGVHVAKLAGLPERVVARARQILTTLEAKGSNPTENASALLEDLPLFSNPTTAPAALETSKDQRIIDELNDLDPDNLSPRGALEELYRLKSLLS